MNLPRTVVFLLAWLMVLAPGALGQATKTENVILVTADGLRWQEVFGGADAALMNKQAGGVADVPALKRAYWRETAEERRRALMPFLWEVIVPRGRIYGDANTGEGARVTNGKNFSYPGYNEILSGFADPRIDSNDKRPNPNVTVLEWLNTQPDFRGKVAAFGSWDVFPYILNRERSGLLVNAGWEPIRADDLTESEELLNLLGRETPHVWEGVRFDSFTTQAAIEHLKKRRPRVLYIGLGETDEYAHEGRYDHYLDAAHRFDAALRRLWDAVQSSPQYRDKTSLVVTTDHGRGDAPEGWKHHGATTKGSEMIWVAAIGPDTPTTGAPSIRGRSRRARSPPPSPHCSGRARPSSPRPRRPRSPSRV